MLESLRSVYQRISEIEKSFSKFEENDAPDGASKPFREFLKEASAASDTVASPVSAGPSVSAAGGYASYQKAADAPVTSFDGIIREASKKYGVPETLVKAVIRQESNFNPSEVSHKGAVGLMQIMPSTAEHLGIAPESLADPETNIMGGTKLLGDLISRYGGNLYRALAAYNAGAAAVDSARGVPEIPETQDYVKRVIGYFGKYNGQR
ncbi:MAG: lytic transglycosylase domain-containing protein [Spirochaetota bacterium]